MFEQMDAESKSKDLAAVFESPATLRTLAPSSSPFIPIVTTDEAERELVTVYRNHHSIVVRPRNAVDSEPDIALDLLRHDSFEKALAAMNITGDAVERLAPVNQATPRRSFAGGSRVSMRSSRLCGRRILRPPEC